MANAIDRIKRFRRLIQPRHTTDKTKRGGCCRTHHKSSRGAYSRGEKPPPALCGLLDAHFFLTAYLTLMGGSCPKKDYDEVDGVETAYLLLDRDDAAITPFGVVYDNGMKLEPVYDGLHFPEYHHNPSLMTLSVRDEAGDGTTYLYLPALDLQIERLLCRTGHSIGETGYTIQECNLPPQLHSGVERGDNTIQSLNHLCQTLMTLTEPQLNELSAVVEQAVSGSVHEELEIEMGGM